MTVKQCKLDSLIGRMWRQAESKGYAELNPDDVISLAALKAELDEARGQVVSLAVENAVMKSAFDKPQAYLSWHAIPSTWDEPLPCGEYLDVHDTAGHKNSDGTDCWPVFAKPEIATPTTDAAIANIKAQGVNKAISKLEASKFGDEGDLIALRKFAAELRKGASND